MKNLGEFKDYILGGVVSLLLLILGWLATDILFDIRDEFRGIRTEIGSMTDSINTLNVRLGTISTDQGYLKSQGIDHEIRIRQLERVEKP
jgi:hypothetical protein